MKWATSPWGTRRRRCRRPTRSARAHHGRAASPGVALTNRSSATSPKFINAQFSQTQSAADDYSFDLMKQKGMNQKGLVTAFQKLAKLDGGKHDGFAPSSASRAQHIEDRIAKGS